MRDICADRSPLSSDEPVAIPAIIARRALKRLVEGL
jgi:hypothetical protein